MKKFTLFLFALFTSIAIFAQTQMSGEYTVGTGGTYDYASLADAGMAIKSAEFTDDVTLLICTDLTETINTGIVNKSNYTLTIRPDKDENRTITYTTAKDNTGPTGVFVIGGDMTKTPGTTIGWASIPTRNVIVDGAAAGYTTPRLKITNEVFGTNVLLYGDVQDVIIRNCILVGRSSSTAYALVFRSENYSQTTKDIAPQNCLVENCVLQSSSSSSQTVYFQGNQANSVAGWPTNITLRDCSIKARTRGMYVRQVKNLNIEGCTFDMSNSSGGILAHAIMGEGARGTINVKGNKFIKNSTANYHGGAYGLQTITASGGADVWVIENNYFAGYDALKAISNTTNGTEARLVAVRCGDYCEVRHNTFHMPNLTKDQASKLVSASPTTLLWLAGSHQYPVQNNIFVCEETTANVSLIRGGLNENVTGNVFYHKGGNAAIVAASPSCMTFVDLETSYPAQAATSKWTNVTFADAANGDLSLDGSSDGDANLAVDRLAEVLTDINGKARREKTYAGAYEGGEFPAEVCKVDVTVTPVGSGIVEGAGECAKGSDVTLTPKPNTGYEFTGWTFEDETTSTDNPLIITVDGDRNITADFAKKQYTLTVLANDDAKGDVTGNGTYEYGTEVEITATPKSGYEFTGWSNGSKENPLTITMEENTELTANFRAILPTSITLYAHPVKDYSASIVGTMKRAIQNGENTIVLTHEDNGTPHIYNIAHATKEVTEISQVGVVAVDPDNAGDFLAISDIALTDDGKLVACNYMMCQITANEVDAGYKRGTSRFYIWDNLGGDPRLWISSQLTGNYYRASMGYTMALKGTSMNAEVTISAFNKTNTNTRYSHLYIVDGTYSDANYKYSRDNAALHPSTLGPNTYELNASPLAAGQWILDGELTSPIEFVEKNTVAIDTYTALSSNVLGKKYNGASYLFHKDHHLMIAPYAADDKLAGVKVLGITDGFGSAVEVTTSTNLVSAVNAVAAAATAYVDGDGDLTIYLIADGKVYTFSEKVYTAQTFTVTATAGEGGSVEGGGTYEEGATAKLTATPNEHYTFTGWSGYVTSTDNPLTITVNSAVELTASFTEDAKSTITVTSIDENMGTVSGSGTYYEGETVTLSAIAKGGYTFVKWNDEETAATRTITVGEDDATYTAHFKQATSRAWAYDLTRTENGENYDFTFTATSDGNATILFTDKDGNAVAPTQEDVGDVTAGETKTVSIAKTQFTGDKDIYWSVKMAGEAIAKMAEITDPTEGIYNFYVPQGIAVDNNTNSNYFGQIYVAQATNGASDGGSEMAKNQTVGLFVYDQKLTLKNTNYEGIAPQNVAFNTGNPIGSIDAIRQQMHRIAVDPITSEVAFAYYKSDATPATAVYAMNPDDLQGDATNLIEGANIITKVNSLCYDEKGTLYVMDNANTGTVGGQIYKVQNGEVTLFAAHDKNNQWAVYDNAMASDGRGGIWIAQNRYGYDYPILSHVNKYGVVDFAVKENLNSWFPNNNTGSSYRGQLAYNLSENILAFAGNKMVTLFTVEYDGDGKPTINKLMSTPLLGGGNIDGVAFDYAGDLYVASASAERLYKFVVPTNDNTCTVPAPESQVIQKEQRYTVTVNTVGNGSATGAGEYVAGETATLEASPAANHQFVNWTYDSETSNDNPLSLVVNGDITVTANFEPVQYTLIAPTNDENKGTVTGAGTYAHGTEVMLEATPKAGYKLLYWSDRSTDNPRTITMTKNEAISAYFVKEYAEEPTFKIEKMWENTNVPASTGNGYQAVGWDGKIYVKERGNDKITVYLDATTSEDYAQTDNADDQSIAVDNAGNLVLRSGSTNFYDSPTQIILYKKGETTYKTIDFTLPETGRCDFISASGDIYSAEGGYVYFYCQNQTTVSRLYIKNGGASAADISVDKLDNATLTAGSSQSHVFTNIFGDLMTHTRDNNYKVLQEVNVLTGAVSTMNLPNFKKSTLGGCSFELGGKEFIAYNIAGTDYNSEWNLYNMTDKEFVSNETLFTKDKVSKNTAANWLNVQVVDENTAYIYQFCPTVGVAVWKVSIEAPKYTRTVINGDYGTICLPYGSSDFTGAEFYEIAYLELEADGTTPKGIWLDEVTELEAGKPYIFKATASELVVYYEGEEALSPIEGAAGLTGTFSLIEDLNTSDPSNTLEGNYMIADNKFWLCGTGCWLNANRAYIKHDALHASTTPVSPMPGRRRVYMGGAGENSATGTEDMIVPNQQVQKVIENGQLIIIRDGVKYNAQGVRL